MMGRIFMDAGYFCYVDQHGNGRRLQMWIEGVELHIKDESGHQCFIGELMGLEELPIKPLKGGK